MIDIAPNWSAVIGLAVTVIFGLGVRPVVRHVGNEIGLLPPPSEATAAEWARLAGQNTGGWWIGFFERPIFFASFWVAGAWPLLTSWLAFKLAIYWQSTNFWTASSSIAG